MPTALERLDAMVAEITPRRAGHLSFSDMCGAFYALYRGFPQSLVAKSFGISQAAASKLARCRINPRAYVNVAAEFKRLGPEEFGETYFTDDIADRIARFRANVQTPGDLRRGRTSNAAADSEAGLWLMNDDQGDEHTVEVYWADATGWRHREEGRWAYVSHRVYETSRKAREAAYANYLAQRQERRRA